MDGKVLSFFFFKNQKYLQIFIFTIWSVKLIQCYYEIFAYFSCVIVIEMKTTWSVTAIPRIHNFIFNKGNVIFRRNYPAFECFCCFIQYILRPPSHHPLLLLQMYYFGQETVASTTTPTYSVSITPLSVIEAGRSK